MDAVKQYANGEAAVLAVLAGNDMLITSDYQNDIPAVLAAVADGASRRATSTRTCFASCAISRRRGGSNRIFWNFGTKRRGFASKDAKVLLFGRGRTETERSERNEKVSAKQYSLAADGDAADSIGPCRLGPKAQLTVKVVNAPSEPYYLDLLEKGIIRGTPMAPETGMTHTAGWIGATPRRKSPRWMTSCWTRCGQRCRRAGTPAPRRGQTARRCGAT